MLSLGKGGNLAFAIYFAARLGKGVFANAVYKCYECTVTFYGSSTVRFVWAYGYTPLHMIHVVILLQFRQDKCNDRAL